MSSVTGYQNEKNTYFLSNAIMKRFKILSERNLTQNF